MKKGLRNLVIGIIMILLVCQCFFPDEWVQAAEVDDIVSVRTVDRDIMLGTTVNSPYSSENIIKNMSLDTSLAQQSYNVNTTTIDATDLSNWYVYDHYDTKAYADKQQWLEETGYNENLRPYYGYTERYPADSTMEKAITIQEAFALNEQQMASIYKNVYPLKEHIAAKSEDGNASMQFYGYGTTACTDFLFYPAQQTGTKKVEYTIDAKQVKTHSLSQAGFLFNCGIQNGTLTGYVMAFSFKPGPQASDYAVGFKSVSLYKIVGMPIDNLHNNSQLLLPSQTNSYLTEIKKVDLSSLEFSGHFDISNIEMRITNNLLQVYMTEAGNQVGNAPKKTTLFDIQRVDASKADTYCGSYTPSGYGGFGPFVGYQGEMQGHSCSYTSSYIYSNLKMSIAESDSVLSGLSNADYTKTKLENGEYVDNDKYFILIGDNMEGEQGYKDCFKRDYDDVYLEMLKKQGVILITNLNIENQSGNINGTNYNLVDYLGEDNVIQVTGDTERELAANIEAAILSAKYSKDNAAGALDALDSQTGTGHEDHATARCMVTYQGLQVDKVNVSRIGSGSVNLIIDDSMSIQVSNPRYSLRTPMGETRSLFGNEITIRNDVNWPAGEYWVIVSYDEDVSAKTSFYLTSSYNSYFNGVASAEGREQDHLSCISNTLGVNAVTPGQDYVTQLVPDDGYELPKEICVKVDSLTTGTITDDNGIVRDGDGNEVELRRLEADEYTYDSHTGVITVLAPYITGNVYVYGDTAKITYQLTNVSVGENPISGISSYNKEDVKIDISPSPSVLPMPNRIGVVIDGREYYVSKGLKKTVLKGTVSYKDNVLTISKELLGRDITVKAVTGEFEAKYNVNKAGIVSGTENAAVAYGQDYDNILTAENGFYISKVLASLGEEKDEQGNPTRVPQSFSFDESTGKIHVDGSEITDTLLFEITVAAKQYNVISEVSHATMEGNSYCKSDEDYSSRFVANRGYDLPEQMAVSVSGQAIAINNYDYNKQTGTVWVDGGVIRGDLRIEGKAVKKVFSVTSKMKNITFSGDTTCDMLTDYEAEISPKQGYRLPEDVIVSSKGTVLTREQYSYDKKTGKIVVPGEMIQGNLLIQARAEKKPYRVINEVSHTSYTGDNFCMTDVDYSANLSADYGYELPETITVCVGDVVSGTAVSGSAVSGSAISGSAISGSGVSGSAISGSAVSGSAVSGSTISGQAVAPEFYEYNPYTGKLWVDGRVILGDIILLGKAEKKLFPVIVKGKHISYEGEAACDLLKDYCIVLQPEDNYVLPEELVITSKGTRLNRQQYQYDSSTGNIVVSKDAIQGELVIAANGERKPYSVTANLSHARMQGDNFCKEEQDYEAEFVADYGYELPEQIITSVSGQAVSGENYEYSKETGKYKLNGEIINGDVVIDVSANKIQYQVTTDMTNLSYRGADSCNLLEDYKGKIQAEKTYELPEKIQIKIGGKSIAEGQYSYNPATGEISIGKDKICGDILIRASGIEPLKPLKQYAVTYRLDNLSSNGGNVVMEGQDYVTTLIPKEKYGLPQTMDVTSDNKVLQAGVDYGYNGETGVVTIPAESIVGDIRIEASGILKTEQAKPDVSKLTVIPPKYENSFDGKVIGVTTAMEYSTDNGKTWTPCKGNQITGLGTGRLSLRFAATGTKNSSPIASIDIDSATMEYYLPTISMTKQMGKNKKFQLKILNTKGAAIRVESSNPSVVTVNKKGVISSRKKLGKAKVVVTIIKGKHIVQYVANIKVVKKVKKNYSLSRFKSNYKAPTIALYKKLTKGKKWKIGMTHTKNATISYRSSNKRVATISKTGVVKGKRSGNTRITITVSNGGVIDQYYVVLRVVKKGEASDYSYLKELK